MSENGKRKNERRLNDWVHDEKSRATPRWYWRDDDEKRQKKKWDREKNELRKNEMDENEVGRKGNNEKINAN